MREPKLSFIGPTVNGVAQGTRVGGHRSQNQPGNMNARAITKWLYVPSLGWRPIIPTGKRLVNGMVLVQDSIAPKRQYLVHPDKIIQSDETRPPQARRHKTGKPSRTI